MNMINKKAAYIGCLGLIGILSTEFGIVGILPQIADHYTIKIDDAGYLLSAFALVIALTGPLIVLKTAHFDRRSLMLLAILLFVLSNFLSALAPPYGFLLVLRILPAFLQPVFVSIAVSIAIEGVTEKMQHRLMSIVIGGIAIAQVTVIPFSTYIAGIYGWQWSYVIQGIISLITMVSIYAILPAIPAKDRKVFKGQAGDVLKRKNFMLSIIANCLIIAAWFSTYSYFAEYLSKVKSLNEKEISYMLLLFGVMGVVSNYVAGRLLGKSLVKTTVFFLLGTILLPFLLTYSDSSLRSVAFIVGFWGIMYGPCFLTALSYVISAAPDAKEFANSLQLSTGNLGVALGAGVSGWFIGKQGGAIAPWIGAAFGVLALVFITWRSFEERIKK
ncbi:sugar transporter [Flavobacterium sp. Root935]|uniref:MFS transporter n=1 Tax=Flavobacterium sp. Root935 TaxID=1736610 RepID=UPI000708B651|nr:MFS transporter [Flavobacterium sp. Root935]KRD58794.1 sugar transporter [Flavobacterium sp. Root935]